MNPIQNLKQMISIIILLKLSSSKLILADSISASVQIPKEMKHSNSHPTLTTVGHKNLNRNHNNNHGLESESDSESDKHNHSHKHGTSHNHNHKIHNHPTTVSTTTVETTQSQNKSSLSTKHYRFPTARYANQHLRHKQIGELNSVMQDLNEHRHSLIKRDKHKSRVDTTLMLEQEHRENLERMEKLSKKVQGNKRASKTHKNQNRKELKKIQKIQKRREKHKKLLEKVKHLRNQQKKARIRSESDSESEDSIDAVPVPKKLLQSDKSASSSSTPVTSVPSDSSVSTNSLVQKFKKKKTSNRSSSSRYNIFGGNGGFNLATDKQLWRIGTAKEMKENAITDYDLMGQFGIAPIDTYQADFAFTCPCDEKTLRCKSASSRPCLLDGTFLVDINKASKAR